MNRFRPTTVALLLALVAPLASAQADKRSPMDAYLGDTFFWMAICKAKFITTQAQLEMKESVSDETNYLNCIREGSEVAKAGLAKVLKTTKKPGLVNAVKEYHVAYSTALDGIRPGVDERKISYEMRQQALEEKVKQARTRIDIERM